MKNKKRGFTLIELISVLVILAILALIVTPLVLNVIKKARTAADKRSIDAYGRSIELAIADYLLDNGTFPTSIDQLTIEYTGDRVECENSGINEDGTIYLTVCKVNGRAVEGYTYGRYGAVSEPEYEAYEIGDIVQYNGVQYYVIKDSETSDDAVTLLKAEPLKAEEITTYSAGTGAQTDGNGGMQYHSSSNTYDGSYIKTTIEAWAAAKVPSGLEQVRLITLDDLTNNLGFEYYEAGTTVGYRPTNSTPEWIYNSSYYYYTMSPKEDTGSSVWHVRGDGNLFNCDVYYSDYVVRPVITLSKSAL